MKRYREPKIERRPFGIWQVTRSANLPPPHERAGVRTCVRIPLRVRTCHARRVADTAKQALGMLEMHFVNLAFSELLKNQQCIRCGLELDLKG